MQQRSSRHSDEYARFVSVDMVERLAVRYLTDAQLLDLLIRLEPALLQRELPGADQVLAERPQIER